MTKKSFFYKDPKIFNLGLLLIHGKNLKQRYEYIAEQVGKIKVVLEPGCGTGNLINYLKKACVYRGFDLNEDFVNYAHKKAKKKGHQVWIGDAVDPSNYLRSDTIVICDSMHHFGLQNEKPVLENALNTENIRKIIICDPFKDQYLKRLPKWIPGSQLMLEKWYDYIEQDGQNQVKLKNIRTKEELTDVMMNGFGVIPTSAKRDLHKIGEDLIVTYQL